MDDIWSNRSRDVFLIGERANKRSCLQKHHRQEEQLGDSKSRMGCMFEYRPVVLKLLKNFFILQSLLDIHEHNILLTTLDCVQNASFWKGQMSMDVRQ